MKQKLFSFPLYFGMKRRVAKKWLRRYWSDRDGSMVWFYDYCNKLSAIGVGGLISDCSGLNSKITELEPRYIRIGGGRFLVDVDITTTTNSCSVKHCGVYLPKTKYECDKYREEIIARPSAKEWDFDIRYGHEVMTINNDGTYSTDYKKSDELVNARKKTSEQ